MKKQSNPEPPHKSKRPKPPPPPPNRIFRTGLLGTKETKDSICAREDYEAYMRGWSDGFNSAKDT